jgi:hypothetical protein
VGPYRIVDNRRHDGDARTCSEQLLQLGRRHWSAADEHDWSPGDVEKERQKFGHLLLIARLKAVALQKQKKRPGKLSLPGLGSVRLLN